MKRGAWIAAVSLLAVSSPSAAQTFPTDDPILRAIQDEGTRNSHVERLAQALLDSIGPRLNGSPQMERGQAWLLGRYEAWGIPARNERYGTWRSWERGIHHIHLTSPRVRSLDGMPLAWSPGTEGRTLEGEAVLLPDATDPAAFEAWLPQVAGRFVLISFPEPTCRPDDAWQALGLPATVSAMQQRRAAERVAWQARVQRIGLPPAELARRLEQAGALGILSLNWSGGYGVRRVFDARTQRAPTFDLSCEDYGLVARLAEAGQQPRLRVYADARFHGEVPVSNTIAEIRGRELADEYVVLSAHFDSWDGASGATDNGTGTVVMMEAMRILRAVLPNPRRTIMVGHWTGEEQGLIGSRAFAFDRPDIVRGLQALFNQDNGTGRVSVISMMGFSEAGRPFARWLSAVPTEISTHIDLELPGAPAAGGSDHAAFICHGAPGFRLGSLEWDYRTYTWHTNRDTYDKVVLDEVRNNAILTAMLAYLAAQDQERMPRTRRALDAPPGQPGGWPGCPQPARSWEASGRR